MSDLLTKCEVCNALIDEEDLFCANCGTEAPHDENQQGQDDRDKSEAATHSFECTGCGASMSYDASAQTLRCPFCGSDKLEEQANQRVLVADRVVPMQIGREEAIRNMRKWLGKGFWRPGDLSEAAVVNKITPVYVPYWVFSANTHTYWTADTNQLPYGARGDWQPLTGEHQGRYEGLLVGASGALTSRETSRLCPFDLSQGVPPEEVDLENVTVEQFKVGRKYARPLARQGFENLERQTCESRYVPGRARNVKVNVRVEDLTSEPVLLPIWIMAYRYNEKTFRFLLNGQTGASTGEAPTSWKKLAAAAAIGLGLILLLLVLIAGFGG